MTVSLPPARPRILVVDDHVRLRQLIAEGLANRLNADVAQAGDIGEALLILRTVSFTALVSDVNLPSGSSADALPSLRAAAGADVWIVLISAAAPPGLGARALAAGADAFVSKTDGLAALCAALEPALLPQLVTTEVGAAVLA